MELGLNKLPWYGQVGAVAAVAVLATAGFYYFYVADAQTSMTVRRQQLEAKRGELTKAQALAQRLPEFQAEVGDLEARLESLKAVLPEQKDVAGLLSRIQTLATQSNLTIRGFRPQPVATKELHAEWPIGLELDGTYHDLGLFFDRIAKVPRIISVSGVDIRAKARPDPESRETIEAKCVATTFVLLDTRPTAASQTAEQPNRQASR